MARYPLDGLLVRALGHIELTEARLLGRGIVDAGFTRAELEGVVAEKVPDISASALVNEMLQAGLVFEHGGLFRTRMAETVREMAGLRQSFRRSKVSAGKPLVADYRLIHKPRLRPVTNASLDDLWARLGVVSDLEKQAAKVVAPSPTLRAFQVRGAERIASALRDGEERAVVVAAGTGSGKTATFYIPALMSVVSWIRDDPAHWTKVLALYPRKELLKDQFQEMLRWANALTDAKLVSRPVRIGAWFGPTPTHRNGLRDEWKRATLGRKGKGNLFPFSSCPTEDCEGALYWLEIDRNEGIERLHCSESECDYVSPIGMIGLTRESLRKHPADVLFSTTESLNRQVADSDSHEAFGVTGERRLRIVLVDEIHTYEGLTGAQTAYLMRRLRHLAGRPLVWCGLSATLANGRSLASQFFGLGTGQVEVVEPSNDELEPLGAEYVMALRHDPSHFTSPLSVTIQAAMLMSRSLDVGEVVGPQPTDSGGLFGEKMFVFTDKLDVTNRLFWAVMDAEGWRDRGRPAIGEHYPCRTLAHLRSATQSKVDPKYREPSAERDGDGQWWWMAETLGHALDADRAKRVELVSSQSSGAVDKADIIVATSTLEVGYSDDRVGAVLQHRAPRGAANYLQRKGRAGRRIEMRPWTVVTLSGWGRDRLAWQMYDQFLDPIVGERHLPLRNRYVQRIQALYATLDWLSRRLAGVGSNVGGSVWQDLAGPPELVHVDTKGVAKPAQVREGLKRQQRAAELLASVIERGPEFSEWEKFVSQALKMETSELEMLYESSPRPLLLAALPTMHRRLTTGWEGDPARAADVKYRNPMPDFVPSSLFAELMASDVTLTLPAGKHADAESDGNKEVLPVTRVLREFLPGNVTRHFGSEHSDRHWVELPLPSPLDEGTYVVDVGKLYEVRRIGTVQHARMGKLPLCMPTNVHLKRAPSELSDSTSTVANWSVEFELVGDGQLLELPKSLTETVLSSARYLVHGEGSAVRVRRYVADAGGRARMMVGQATTANHAVTFVVDGEQAALGFEYECDGIIFEVAPVAESPTTSWERRDAAAFALAEDTTLPPTISDLNRDTMMTLLDAAVVHAHTVEGLDMEAIAAWKSDELVVRARSSASAMIIAEGEDETTPDVLEFLLTPGIGGSLRRALDILLGAEPEWFGVWRQCRLAATVGAALIEAAMRLQPEIDEQDLTLDVAADGRSVWISELAPGGNGHVEALVRALVDAGGGLTQLIRSQSLPGEFERLGETMDKVVRRMIDVEEVRKRAESLLAAWRLGHGAVADASEALVAALRDADVIVDTAALRATSSRLLSPSQQIEFVDFAGRLVSWVGEVQSTLGYQPDHQVLVWAATLALAGEAPRRADGSPEANTQRLLEQLSWPRQRSAAIHDLVASSLFGWAPKTDRTLLLNALGPDIEPIQLVASESVQEVIAREGEAIIVIPPGDRARLRTMVLESQVSPVDKDGLLLYPKVTGFNSSDGNAQLRFLIEEIEQ